MPKIFAFIRRRNPPKAATPLPSLPLDVGCPSQLPSFLSSASGVHSNSFQQIVGGNHRIKTIFPDAPGGIAYAGLKTTLEALRGPAGAFPPLKAALEGIIGILTIVDRCIQNKQEFYDLKQKLEAIRSIVEAYGSHHALRLRINTLSEALNDCIEGINCRAQHIMARRLLENDIEASFITRSFRNISILLDAFQTDIAINTYANTERILQILINENVSDSETVKHVRHFRRRFKSKKTHSMRPRQSRNTAASTCPILHASPKPAPPLPYRPESSNPESTSSPY